VANPGQSDSLTPDRQQARCDLSKNSRQNQAYIQRQALVGAAHLNHPRRLRACPERSRTSQSPYRPCDARRSI